MKFGREWKNDAMEYSAAMRRIQPRAASPGSRLVRAAALVVLSTILAPLSIGAPLAYERIRDAAAEPHNWLTYSGNYSAHRHSPLQQIDRANAAGLKVLWTHQIDTLHKFEVTPLVVDGVMYLSEPPSDVTALDARTGRPLWQYKRKLPNDIPVCCGEVNRGVAVLGDSVYIGTLDAHLVALDAKSGLVRWDVEVFDYHAAVSVTVAPLAVKDKIVVGMAGGEYGVRGFLDAYDAQSGERAWRFWTVPGPGEPGNETWAGDSWKRGAATTWVTGSYDPELNLVYWGTGNPGPDWNGEVREGDNLYSDSLLALDADSGKLRWHFQFTPHDVHDWDATQVPVLMEGMVRGKRRKLVLFANRNAFYYVLDRETGEFLQGRAYAKQTWAEGLDDHGRPMRLPNTAPTIEGVKIYPSVPGATNWFSPSYSPLENLFYVTTLEMGNIFHQGEAIYKTGSLYTAGGARTIPEEEPYSEVRAFEAETGKLKWAFPAGGRSRSGLLSTAGGLVFGSSPEGAFFALDSSSGKPLWHFQSGGTGVSNPIAYAVDGKQRIAIALGRAIYVFGVEE